MADTPQSPGGRASAQPGHGNVSAAEVERYLGGLDFPADKNELVEYAQSHDAPNEVLELMKAFPEQKYGSPTDVAQAIGQVKH